MTLMIDPNRQFALGLAYQLHHDLGDVELHLGEGREPTVRRLEDEVCRTAEVFLAWLRGPTTLHVTAGPVTDQLTGQVVQAAPTHLGANMGIQIKDTDQFDLTLREVDRLGFSTDAGVVPVWTSSDETVVPVNVSEDGLTFHVTKPLAPGSAMIIPSVTLADGTVITGVAEAVTVTAGDVAALETTAGPVTPQPVDEPAAPAAPEDGSAPADGSAAPVDESTPAA